MESRPNLFQQVLEHHQWPIQNLQSSHGDHCLTERYSWAGTKKNGNHLILAAKENID
jgi:hypothetical protein